MNRPAPVEPQADPDQRLLRRAAFQVALWTSASVIALVVLMVGVVLVLDEHQQHVEADRISRSAWSQADDVGDPPPQTWLIVVTAGGGRRVTPGAPDAVRGLDPTGLDDGIVRTIRDGRELVIFTGDRPIGRVSAAFDMSPGEVEERRLQISLAVAALVGGLGAAMVGVLVGRRAVRPLGAALARQRRFVADASHELRTPLSVLLLRAQMLRRHLPPSTGPRPTAELDRLVKDARVLGEVVSDLLLSMELQRHPKTGEPVDLAAVTSDVVESLQALAGQSSIELTMTPIDTADGGPSRAGVNGAAVALRRATAALVDNAIAHTPPGGHVNVVVTATATRVAVTVSDDGEGLDPADIGRLVGRFTRGTGTGGGRRFGLGLSLVDEVARAHSGTLAVQGAPGAGATFTLSFPRAVLDAPAPRNL